MTFFDTFYDSIKIELTSSLENLPSPLFAKEGYYSSLWQREVRRDFTNQCLHYFETVNKPEG
jgi:hypothetical protein